MISQICRFKDDLIYINNLRKTSEHYFFKGSDISMIVHLDAIGEIIQKNVIIYNKENWKFKVRDKLKEMLEEY